jgi:hypothetical protein
LCNYTKRVLIRKKPFCRRRPCVLAAAVRRPHHTAALGLVRREDCHGQLAGVLVGRTMPKSAGAIRKRRVVRMRAKSVVTNQRKQIQRGAKVKSGAVREGSGVIAVEQVR